MNSIYFNADYIKADDPNYKYEFITQKIYFDPAELDTNDTAVELLKRNYEKNIQIAKKLDLNRNNSTEHSTQTELDKSSTDLYRTQAKDKVTHNFRIMCWNVRYFTNVNDQQTIDKIASVISEHNPDIICLQEATTGYNDYYKPDTSYFVDIRKYLPEYALLSSCLVVPSWYEAMYGNMILVKNEFVNFVKRNASDTYFNNLCTQGRAQGKCLFNQYASTYMVPKPVNYREAGNVSSVFSGETRCYIRISLSEYDLICTHLEAYNKTIRRKQLDELNNLIIRPTIICGDFNVIDVNIYRELFSDPNISKSQKEKINKEWKYVASYNGLTLEHNTDLNDIDYINTVLKWRNGYDILQKKRYPISNWSGTVVDYFFFSEHWDELLRGTSPTKIIDIYDHITEYSDHFPIICDMFDPEISLVKKTETELLKLKENEDSISITEHTAESFYHKALYNSQPLIEYDWFDFSTKLVNVSQKKNFRDPFNTGNFTVIYGLNGIYVFPSKQMTYMYKESFQVIALSKDDISNTMSESGLIYSGLTFAFGIRPDVTVKVIRLGNSSIFSVESSAKANALVNMVDIIQGFSNFLTMREYDKKTGYHKLFELTEIDIVITPKQGGFDAINKLSLYGPDLPNAKEIILSQSNNSLITDSVDNLVTILSNSIEYINRHHHRKTGQALISNLTQISKYIKIDDTIPTVSLDLLSLVADQKTSGQVAGHYHRKYLKYKTKYLKLSKNRNF